MTARPLRAVLRRQEPERLARHSQTVTMIIAPERFVDAVRSLGYEKELLSREQPLR